MMLQNLQAAWQYRKDYVQSHQLEAFRLVHGAGDKLPGLIVDYYLGSFVLTLLDSSWHARRKEIEENLKELSKFLPHQFSSNFFWTLNDPHQNFETTNPPPEVKAINEAGLCFEVQLGIGPHTGLFLDQRENRQRIRILAKNKKVLNLFCYTGAFTIAALKGGAKEVHSVDLSKNYLNWFERNLALNKIPKERAEIYPMDVFQFLKKTSPSQSFDLIILDPPTFSRSGDKNFSTEKDLAELVNACTRLLSKEGQLFVSVNTRKLNPNAFQTQVRLAIQSQGLQILENFSLPWDFHLSAEEKRNPHLKACLVG